MNNRIIINSLFGLFLGTQMTSFTVAMDKVPPVSLGKITIQNTLANGSNFSVIASNTDTKESFQFNVPAVQNSSESYDLPYGNYTFSVKGTIKIRSEFDLSRSGTFSLDPNVPPQFKNDPTGEITSQCAFDNGNNTAVINSNNVELPLLISVLQNDPDAQYKYNEIGCQLVQF